MTSDSPRSSAPTYTELWLPGYDGTQFYTRTYSAANTHAVLLFLHGFAEHVGRYEWAHGVYASKGVSVFAFDQRGFGRTALDKDHKSKTSSYGKTSWPNHISDIEWWLKHLNKLHPNLPVFLMGHSMGGGLALAFGMRSSGPPSKESLSLLSGIIASSPLVVQTFPASRILRYVGGKASTLIPTLLFPAATPWEDLSHNKTANNAAAEDPLIIPKGSLKGLHDMLSGGEQLLWNDYKNWQKRVPLMLVHGDEDRVTSFKASQELYEKLDAEDKEFVPVKGGYHELVHEPDGVKDNYVDKCISWILKRAAEGRRRDTGEQ